MNWSRRPLNGYGPSSENKHITHGIERARARQEIMEEMKQDAGDSLFPGLQVFGSYGYVVPDALMCTIVSGIPLPKTYSYRLVRLLMLHGY